MGYFLFFLLGSIITFAGYTYLTREKEPAPKTFSQTVFLVDQTIQGQLYEIGILKKDILLQEISSKKERGLVWEESLLKIELPRSLSFSTIEGNFRRSLSPFGKNVSLQASQVSGSLRLEVRVRNHITHQLTFLYPRTPVPKPGLRPQITPKIAIVIDDLGGENHLFKELLEWDIPITFSILPFTPYSKTVAEEAHRRGREIILHLPMEPYGYPKVRPGEGVLLEEMNEERLRAQLSKDLEAVPFIKGVSNHMGSRLMEDPEKIGIVLSELKKRDLFFLDSRTTSQTVGLKTAQSLGLKSIERSFFLDHFQDEKEIHQKIEGMIRFSLATGKAVGIGHPHPSTLKSIKEMIPKMKEKGVEIVPLSSLMD
jgi:uncharacterized protein